jgi:hypothetical protein
MCPWSVRRYPNQNETRSPGESTGAGLVVFWTRTEPCASSFSRRGASLDTARRRTGAHVGATSLVIHPWMAGSVRNSFTTTSHGVPSTQNTSPGLNHPTPAVCACTHGPIPPVNPTLSTTRQRRPGCVRSASRHCISQRVLPRRICSSATRDAIMSSSVSESVFKERTMAGLDVPVERTELHDSNTF